MEHPYPRHRSGTPLTRNGRRVAAFSMPRCLYLLALVFCEPFCKVVLLFLCDIVVELNCGPGIRIVITVELLAFWTQEAV
jgi:hypothetical protein